MATTQQVTRLFKNLENGDGKGFFDHVADDVDWTLYGTHPLAGHYHSKADFLAHTFQKLDRVLCDGAQIYVEHALLSDDWAVVEMRSHAIAKNGFKYDQHYCWLCRFAGDTIVQVHAYLDSVLVVQLFAENPIQ
jgi:ketosteroid isomerase-like protein